MAKLIAHQVKLHFDYTFTRGSTDACTAEFRCISRDTNGNISCDFQWGISDTAVGTYVTDFGLNYISVTPASSGTLELIWDDVDISSGDWEYSAFEIFYNGSSVYTDGPNTITAIYYDGPAAVPIIGCGLKLIAGAYSGGMSPSYTEVDMRGGISWKLTSGDSWRTLPVADPPSLYSSTGSTSSADLHAWQIDDPMAFGQNYSYPTFYSNEKPLLNRWNANSTFGMVLARTAVPDVEYRKNGVYYSALASISALTDDIDDTKGSLETDYLERDHYIGVDQNTGHAYLFPARMNGGAYTGNQCIAQYMNEVVDRWGHYSAPYSAPSVNSVTQGIGYSQAHSFQTLLADDRITRLIFTSTAGLPGIAQAADCDFTPTSYKAYSSSSSSLYSAPSGSTTVGASTVTFTGGTAKIDLVSLTTTPFAYGVLADSIQVPNATGTGLRYFLEDAQGKRKEVTPSAGYIDLAQVRYKDTVGSWAQEWGLRALKNGGGTLISDTYPDIPAAGKSSTIWPNASAEKAVQTQLAVDGGWAYLVITCTSGSIVIDHPIFHRTSTLERVTESPDAVLIGTGDRWARFGGVKLYTGSPSIDYPGLPTVLSNWLSWKRLVLEGKAYDDGFDTEITGYGFTTGTTPTNRAFVEGDVAVYFYHTNLHPHFPWSPLDPVTLEPGLGVTNDLWQYARIGSKTFGFGDYLEMYDGGSSIVSSPETAIGNLYPSTVEPTTWDLDHTLKIGGNDLATVRPVWCFTGAYGATAAGRLVAMAVRRDLMNYRARADGGSVDVEKADNSRSSWSALGSSVSGDECCLFTTPTAIYLGVIESGAFKVYKSTGGSWSLSTTVTSSGDPACPVSITWPDGMVFLYWLDGGTVKGQRYDRDMNPLGSAFTATGIGTVDDGGLAGAECVAGGNGHYVLLSAIETGVLTTYQSSDGEAFS